MVAKYLHPLENEPVRFAAVNDTVLAWQSLGPENGPAVVLGMGLGGQMCCWNGRLLTQLAAAGYRVIAFDHRDAGLSYKHDHLRTPKASLQLLRYSLGLTVSAPYSLEDMATDVLGLLDHLQIEKAHLMGTSMGGMILQLAALRAPERVMSLVSISSSCGDRSLPMPDWGVLRTMLDVPATGAGRSVRVQYGIKVLRLLGSPNYYQPDEALAAAEALHDRGYSEMGRRRQLCALLLGSDMAARLQDLPVPALVIHGKRDRVLPLPHGEALAKALPKATLSLIDDMGHSIEGALGEQVASMSLAFWESLAGTGNARAADATGVANASVA